MSRRKVLWGYTRLGAREVKIYKRFGLVNYDGLTHEGKSGIWIDIHADVFDDPVRLDETLIHEFIHVLEYYHAEALDFGEKNCCSPGVRLLGSGLTQMFRELRQAGVEQSAPRRSKGK